MSVREALKLLRYELGITQEDFAEKIDRAFVTVNRWENGKGFPSRANAKSILDVAKKGQASQDCVSYLEEVLYPDTRRNYSAIDLGYADIDREFIFQLADGSTNAVYVIEADSYRLLYTNRKADRMATHFIREQGTEIENRTLNTQKDKRCYHYFANQNSPCDFCPLQKMDSSGLVDCITTIPQTEKKLKIHAKLTENNGKKVYVIYLTDVTDVYAEKQSLYELTNDIPTGVGIYNVYHDGRIELVFLNRLLFAMFDEEKRSVLRREGNTDLCLIHPDDKNALSDELTASIKEKRNVSIDMRMKLSDGIFHMVHLDARIIKKDKEKNVYYCMFHTDSETDNFTEGKNETNN